MKTNKKIWAIGTLYFAAGFLVTNLEVFCDLLNSPDNKICGFASLIDGAAGALVFLVNVMVFAVAILIALLSKTRRRTALVLGFLTLVLAFLTFASRAVFVRFVLPLFVSDALAEDTSRMTPAAVIVPNPTHSSEFFIYLKKLQSHIKKNWSWKDHESPLRDLSLL